MKSERKPQRMCMACREMKDKRELLRIVRPPQGELCYDATGKQAGRGAYLCRSAACLQRARKQRSVERALGSAPGAELWQQLQALCDAE